jgi:hypothetical protein
MNRKQLLTLLALVLVLGGLGIFLKKRQNDSSDGGGSAGMGQKLLGKFDVNAVSRISLKQGSNDINLAKKDNLWRVRERNDYPANYSEISDFLLKLQDIKVIQSETVGASQLPRLSLVPGQGTNSPLVVDFKDQNDQTIKSLLLGKKHMRKTDRPSPYGDVGEEGYPDGRWVKLSDSDLVAVISEPFDKIEPKADQWLNKDFFKIEKPRSIAAAFPAATNSWKLTHDSETAEWKLADAKPGEQLDTTKASGVANPLGSPAFVDVAVMQSPAELGLDKGTVVTVETFDNLTYTIKVGAKTNDNYPLAMTVAAQIPKERTPGKDEKPEDKDKLDKEFKEKNKKIEEKLAQEKPFEKWVYLVSNWTVEPLLKERGQLMAEKKEEKKDEQKLGDTKKDDNLGIDPLKIDGLPAPASTPVPLTPPTAPAPTPGTNSAASTASPQTATNAPAAPK